MSLAAFLSRIQKDCLPGVWSKGMALARESAIQKDSASDTEIILRIPVKDRPVSPKVTLWPEDDDAYCDCGDRNEICAHIAAAVIALKSGKPLAGPEAASARRAPSLAYRFTRKDGFLEFERVILDPKGDDRGTPLTDTLVSYLGGISSGRISAAPVTATREDFGVDAALGISGPRRGRLDHPTLSRLLGALAECAAITLDGNPIKTSSKSSGLRGILEDAPGGGFRLRGQTDESMTEVFSNGAALCGDTLRPIETPSLSPLENQALSQTGKLFRTPEEVASLVTELLPALQLKLPLEIISTRLPRPKAGTPRIRLRVDFAENETLIVAPSIEYTKDLAPDEIIIRDPQAERALLRKLQNELHLQSEQATRLEGSAALDFTLKLEARAQDWDIHGNALPKLKFTRTELQPRMEFFEEGFRVSFGRTEDGKSGQLADPAKVFRAWQNGEDHVPLLAGGWARLPMGWLEKHGAQVLELLNRQHDHKQSKLPAALLPELAELGHELGEALPPKLHALRERLIEAKGIPSARLPKDLRAELRAYQRAGVDWLVCLRDSGMGALLADDMGLGKTLQTLCAIQGRTLVVVPTSVLSSWSEQIARFRPSLRVSLYYGATRALDPKADVTLTSYALMRLDNEALCAQNWDTIVLDEAQTIKNPESQVARAAHRLPGRFRVALTGTPIENRLEDLWSQFQFVNPGLLGSLDSFQERYAGERLRHRIRPFLLRRLKKDVAPELPPRTETLLHCELSESERELYQSIFAASRKEVVEKLEHGGNVMAALEMLLRLRQACCHPALVTSNQGAQGSAQTGTSSKIDLLMETLDESISLGHRALVFSQWTSLLDRIEPELQRQNIPFLRLDGSTPNRPAIVEAFQRPEGPPVLLMSLKAGGVGLTLTAADHVFLMDPWWNPAAEDQAADRAHRIGQLNPVLIHRLVAKDTVEDRILALQKRKQELAASVLDGTGSTLSLTRDDLLDLLR